MTKNVIDFNRLPKQKYIKPMIQIVELKHRTMILAGSVDEFGMNRQLQGTSNDPADEVEEAWQTGTAKAYRALSASIDKREGVFKIITVR